jgi:hypothetical protein
MAFVCLLLPIGVNYLNADPTIQLVKLTFQVLPIIPFAFNSVSPILLPLILTPNRYMLIVLYGFEVARMLCLQVILMFMFTSQLQDAFDFQVDSFQKSMRTKLNHTSLKHVLKYREIIIVRDTLKPIISLGSLVFVMFTGALILFLNFSIVRMFHDLSTLAWLAMIYLTFVSMFIFKTILNAGATIEQTSVHLLRSFHFKTKQLHGKDLRYVTRANKSLPVFSLYLGLPGLNILQVKHSTTSSAFLFILDNTITFLLTF